MSAVVAGVAIALGGMAAMAGLVALATHGLFSPHPGHHR